MTRGNQRDIDRKRAEKRRAKQNAQKKEGNVVSRMQSDAEIMRQKQLAAEERKKRQKNGNNSNQNNNQNTRPQRRRRRRNDEDDDLGLVIPSTTRVVV
eukprot:TRINITY_DN1218_c0_g1_i3.p1 TRINITY_DN1218_c0_g1~~TRINITY_DN1218_c0_g1_i3.p1  ORF type:complete len:110 (-),score=14.79 TRINITY_DN1218_c0_g1_i3:907-1200(-)